VDACGAGSRAVTFLVQLLRPGRRIASQCLSAWTIRNAAPILLFEATSAQPGRHKFGPAPASARSARCPLREPDRCHSVHETAAQPQRNVQPITTGDAPLTARRRRHRPKLRHRRQEPTGPGRSPRETSRPAQRRTKSRWRSHRENTTSFETNHDTEDEPGTARRRRHQRWNKEPTEESTGPGRSSPVIMMMNRTMNHRTAKPGTRSLRAAETPRSRPRSGQGNNRRTSRKPSRKRNGPRAARTRSAAKHEKQNDNQDAHAAKSMPRSARSARGPAAGQETKRRTTPWGNETKSRTVSESGNTKGEGRSPESS
jgi:hypothetical protein